MKLGKSSCKRLVHDQQESFILEQEAILLDGEISVVFIQGIVRIRRRLYVFLVVVYLAIQMVEKMVPLKPCGC